MVLFICKYFFNDYSIWNLFFYFNVQTIAYNKGDIMNKQFEIDEWKIIEKKLNKPYNRLSESIMSLGNSYMGIRGNFILDYSGDSLKGTYIAGIYYPDKTKVGWWKIGYPKYFAKVINSPDFLGIRVAANGMNIDLNSVEVDDFNRVLDMKNGLLDEQLIIKSSNGRIRIETERFLSAAQPEIACILCSITPLDSDIDIEFTPFINANVSNEDSNYDEKFWDEIDRKCSNSLSYIMVKTKKLNFALAEAMKFLVIKNGEIQDKNIKEINKPYFVGYNIPVSLKSGETASIYKFVSVLSSRYYDENYLQSSTLLKVNDAYKTGYSSLLDEHKNKWNEIWDTKDIKIEGDDVSQQAIRYNIFQLCQTFNGCDSRLNFGPKGFTGEKYGGSTYWDTEAFCLPYCLGTYNSNVAKNLLLYRYDQLDRAKENAKKLGLKGALYPMVTMNGEECHNEWEITFEEIHRNSAIAYAIYNYINYTDDKEFMVSFGFEMLIEICRFIASRVTYNKRKNVYMILGVTGPNEYENNVNNNWYTNIMASWCIEYMLAASEILKNKYKEKYNLLKEKLSIDDNEYEKWKDIALKMYCPYDSTYKVFEQQDGFMDKDITDVSTIPQNELPINKHWSWDKILRSCFIKQADVLMGIYLLKDRFDNETIKRNFDFYEPLTVHESSLSACIHSVIASWIGYKEKAYKLFLRSVRLDLDNCNCDTKDGLHITSMAGGWITVVHGFAGMKVENGILTINPSLPAEWTKVSFNLLFRERRINIEIEKSRVIFKLIKGDPVKVRLNKNLISIEKGNLISINY